MRARGLGAIALLLLLVSCAIGFYTVWTKRDLGELEQSSPVAASLPMSSVRVVESEATPPSRASGTEALSSVEAVKDPGVEVEKRRDLSGKLLQMSESSGDVNQAALYRSMSQTIRTDRWVFITTGGDLVILRPEAIPGDTLFSLTANTEGGYTLYDHAPNIGKVVLKVNADGSVQLVEGAAGISPAAAGVLQTLRWPCFTARGRLCLPEGESILSAGTAPQQKSENVLGWLMLDTNGILRAPDNPEVPPVPDAIWVERASDGGLRLIQNDSLYCIVAPDRKMSYPGEAPAGAGDSCYWQFEDDDELPALFRSPSTHPACPPYADAISYGPFGPSIPMPDLF